MKPTTRQRVLDILLLGMRGANIGSMYLQGELIKCRDGWIPQWVFASIRFCGTTEGKRRLRELRNDPDITAKYEIETKHEGHDWYYRIRERAAVHQAEMAFS